MSLELFMSKANCALTFACYQVDLNGINIIVKPDQVAYAWKVITLKNGGGCRSFDFITIFKVK